MSWLLLETSFLPSQRADTRFLLENIKKDLDPELQERVQETLESQYKNLFKAETDGSPPEIDADAEEVINAYADCLKDYRENLLERLKVLELRARSRKRA